MDIPNIDVESLNQEQLMAYNIVLKTLHLFIRNNEDFEPLIMVITGTDWSGKSYLIKCIVKAVQIGRPGAVSNWLQCQLDIWNDNTQLPENPNQCKNQRNNST